MTDIFIASLVGALISLDRTAFLQVMISQPIVAGPLIGLVLGDPVSGLIIGGALELFWIGALPVGSSVPPNETVAAVVATTVCISGSEGMAAYSTPSAPIIVVSILLSIPLAIMGQRVDIYVRNFNRRFARHADILAGAGKLSSIGREHLKGLVSFFIGSFISLMILIGFGFAVMKAVYPWIPAYLSGGFTITVYLFIALGTAVLLRTARGGMILPVFAAGALTGFIFISLKEVF